MIAEELNVSKTVRERDFARQRAFYSNHKAIFDSKTKSNIRSLA